MEEQLDNVINDADADAGHLDPEAPLMPFPTAYVLTREQEAKMVDWAVNRMGELEIETGRDRVSRSDDWLTDSIGADRADPLNIELPERTFMGSRRKNELTYANDVRHRAITSGGIFEKSNITFPVTRNVTTKMIARAGSYYFSTDPWFAVYPIGDSDRQLADKADRFYKHKIEEAKLKSALGTAIERAFSINEGVVKTVWRREERVSKSFANVLVDEDGKDILGADGDYIYQTDDWVMEAPVPDPANPNAEIPGQVAVLKRDNTTGKPEKMIWQRKIVTRKRVAFNQPESTTIHYLDFLCPLNARSIEDADCCIHIYDEPVMRIADRWKKSLPDDATVEKDVEATVKAIEMIRSISSGSGETRSGQNSTAPGIDRGAGSGSVDQPSAAIANIAEFHIRHDFDGDGIMEEIMLVLDTTTKTPLFYDYEDNITPDGKRHFTCVRAGEVANRWYGIGAIQMFENYQQIVDLLVNRRNLRQSESGRITFWDASATVEGSANPDLVLNWGETYRLRPGKKPEDAIRVVYLENNSEEALTAQIELYMQLLLNESGVMGANDSQTAGLESSKLATGVRNIEKAAQERFSLFLTHLEPGITEVLEKNVNLIHTNLDDLEAYEYFEEDKVSVIDATGKEVPQQPGQGVFYRIDPMELKKLRLDTKVLLTRYRGEQVIESTGAAISATERYFSYIPEFQQKVTPMFRDLLKVLQVAKSDEIISPSAMPLTGPSTLPDQSAAPNQPKTSNPNL